MKKRLLMILGAGSSIECGMPSVSAIDAQMSQWAARHARTSGRENFYDCVWRALEDHVEPGFESMREAPNFEHALGDLAALMHWVRPSSTGNALRVLVGEGTLTQGLRFSTPSRHGPNIEIKSELSHLLATLATFMRDKARALDANSESVRRWKALLDAFRERFDIAIYTLNYDNVALTCWPDAFTGFDNKGDFDPASVHERRWNGLMHLHGSVHFSLKDILGDQICWRPNLHEKFNDCDDRSADEKSDGRYFPSATLIAGGFKLDQLLAEPFSTYHSALVRDAALADAIVLGGYGFTDVHVNRALQNALRFRYQRPPALVLEYANPNTDPMEFRNDRWSNVLARTLHAPGPYAPPRHSHPERPIKLAESLTCECSPAHETAIWYAGFLAAGRASDRLLDWLDGAGDAALRP